MTFEIAMESAGQLSFAALDAMRVHPNRRIAARSPPGSTARPGFCA
jgi:hypothetical protein